MCLAIPGKLTDIRECDFLPMGNVDFGGIQKQVCLAYVPDSQVGDYVLVHAGFAISTIDEEEAQQVLSYIEQIGELAELEQGGPGDSESAPPRASEKAPAPETPS